ncbi:CoA-binding protein [uncultured Sneathiella sp.]|jgi:predicted CoA-binding protein|uniref:CoA-binding protein n=1 Tax=uncultured Sneathiella sp. TaxID=879315 RepID=UPI0030DDBA40|tara:strand:+ start:249 stop:740 length:492 start_codon:yes stop_codon:yes gene_type:complete
MNHDTYADEYIGGILNDVKTIAVVGASSNSSRPSYYVMKYLKRKGYRCIPVNPGLAGQELLGETAYGSLSDIPVPIDMVDCFRASEAIPPIVEEAIKVGAKVIWMQLGVRHDEAAKTAEAAGLKVVMNRCPKIEYGRLSGEIAFMGGRSGMISSKRSKLVGNK